MKKTLAILLCVVMLITLCVPAWSAAEEETVPGAAVGVPTDVTDPTQTSEPADVTDPTQTSEPADATDPTETSEPADVTDPTETSEPADATNPIETSEPANPTGSNGETLPEETVSESASEENSVMDSSEVLSMYNQLMACTFFEEMEVLVELLGEENCIEMLAALTEEERTALEQHISALVEAAQPVQEEQLPPAVNYANVAPFATFAAPASPFAMLRAAAPRVADNGVEFSKSVVEDSENPGSFIITLEAFTTGTVTISTDSKPCDIILVLDRSTSMREDFSSSGYSYTKVYDLKQSETYYVYVEDKWGSRYQEVTWCSNCQAWTDRCTDLFFHIAGNKYTPKNSADDRNGIQFYTREYVSAMSRMDALHSAANAFVDTVSENSPDSRIAVVSFGTSGTTHTGYSASTALLTVKNNVNTIKSAINGISASDSATEHGDGLASAVSIFGNSDSTDRNRVVVMITDGEPAPRGTDNWSSRIVKEAVENAYTLKNQYSSSVYCISVMPGTDASNPTTDMDKYMSYVSSNYPNARYTGSTGSWYDGYPDRIINQITSGGMVDTSNGSFYLTASDLDTLNQIFEEIADQTGGSKTKLDASAVVRDVVTPYFTMPTASNIKVETYDCLSYNEDTGNATWSQNGTVLNNAVTVSGNTIDVSGFDFDRNFVAENGRVEGDVTQAGDFHGRKLVITFTVTPKDTFLGGNDVPTNVSAGIYQNKDAMDPISTAVADPVDVDVKTITPAAQDQNIYLTNEFDPSSLAGVLDSRFNGTDNAFAEVTFTIKSGNSVVATYTIKKGETSGTWAWASGIDKSPAADVTYTVTCEVNGGTGNTSTGSNSANINVFTPKLTFRDSQAYYGETISNDFSENHTGTSWKHGTTVDTSVQMIGNVPTLTLVYTPEVGKIEDGKIATKRDIGVDVEVKIRNEDVTGYTGFVHTDCGADPCDVPENREFVIHVNTCQLTITKTGGTDGEPYVFTILKDGKAYTYASITGNGSVTIAELPVGTYAIQEDAGWSWRYTADNGFGATLSSENPAGSITCRNENRDPYWLNGYSDVVVNTFDVPHTVNAQD